jgi:hypothetical protein
VTVTAPPRPSQPPGPRDLVGWAEPEALIAEARQRARRRRRRYAAAVAVLALLATSFIVVFGRPGPSQSLSPDPPPTLPVPPDPDKAASIVAKFGKLHVGWVLVYGDGRVIKYDEAGDVFERRLTANGFNLVRSGAIELRALLPWPPLADRRLPSDTWADRKSKPYVASRYAACFSEGQDDGLLGSRPGHATEAVGRLPATGRQLLRGKERTYSNIDLVARLAVPDLDLPDPPVECFEVSTEEARVLFRTLRRAGFAFGFADGAHPWAGAPNGPCGGIEQPAEIGVCFWPILPHGEWVVWGG